jgi:hypothetical protein
MSVLVNMYLSDSAMVPVGCENGSMWSANTHNQWESSSQVHTHITYTLEGNNLQKTIWWILFCFLQASCWQTDTQTDRRDAASNMPMYIQTSSIPLLIEWRWEGAGLQMNYKCEASQVLATLCPTPTEESSSWRGDEHFAVCDV